MSVTLRHSFASFYYSIIASDLQNEKTVLKLFFSRFLCLRLAPTPFLFYKRDILWFLLCEWESQRYLVYLSIISRFARRVWILLFLTLVNSNDDCISFVDKIISLRVTLFNTLSWHPQVQKITKKVNRVLYGLRIIKPCTS